MNAAATVAAALRQATAALAASDTSRLDAELLLAEALGVARAGLFRAPERVLDDGELQRFDALVAARARGTPAAYLLGRVEFWSMTLEVTPAVLVPRADTELLVEVALGLGPRVGTFVDLGTGCGAIALALARERPDALILATDVSRPALAVAARNIAGQALANIGLVQGRWLRPLRHDIADIVVANPPYIAPEERDSLGPELGYEPAQALFAPEQGLADLHAIIDHGAAALVRGGWLALEHGANQAAAVTRRLQARAYADINTHHDLAGHARVTCGRRL